MNQFEFVVQYVLNNNPKSVKQLNKLKILAKELFNELKEPDSFSFGKHKGQSISEIPNDYLIWLRDKNQQLRHPKEQELFDRELKKRGLSKNYASDDISF